MYHLIGRIIAKKKNSQHLILTGLQKYLPAIPEGTKVLIGYSEKFLKKYTIKEWKIHKSHIFLLLDLPDVITESTNFNEMGVFLEENTLKELLDSNKDETSLYGYTVVDTDSGRTIGEIIDIWYLPANDVYEVKTESGILPIPIIGDVISKIDDENKILYINIIDGLLDLTN